MTTRVYQPEELGADGYPLAWHREVDGESAIKHLVREQAGHRCVRCHHPYVVKSGAGEWSDGPDGRRVHWSACDAECDHQGPFRWREDPAGEWSEHPDGSEPWVPFVAEAWDALIQPEIQAAWRILTVHHLNGHKHDCRWWNLAALCQRCHFAIQGKVVLERVYPLEHSEWFKPYAAGWYAHAYLGVDLTRDETMARLDDLLALERQDLRSLA